MTLPRILLLNSAEGETSTLEELIEQYALLTRVRDRMELRRALETDNYEVLICAWNGCKGGWEEALKMAQEISPDVPVIVCSRAGGEREWVKAIEAGAFDLLAAPYAKRTVLPALEQAVQSREARRLHHMATLSALVHTA